MVKKFLQIIFIIILYCFHSNIIESIVLGERIKKSQIVFALGIDSSLRAENN